MAASATRRAYPNVEGIQDRSARQSVRLLWDRTFQLEDAITAANDTIDAQNSTIASLQTRLSAAEKKVMQALLRSSTTPSIPDTVPFPPPNPGFPPGPTTVTIAGLGSTIIYYSPDTSGWTETGTINRLGFDPGLLTVNYSTMGAWLPGVNIGGALQEATLWLFFQIAGQWYGSGAERFRPSQTTKVESTNYSQWPGDFWYDATRWGPLAGLVPTAGQPAAAYMTAGSTRADNLTLVTERTALLTFSWPADGGSVSFP